MGSKLVRSHPLLLFFAFALILSWAIWIPLLLDHLAVLPLRLGDGVVLLGRLLGTLGPALSAILVARLSGGAAEVRALVGQLARWRVRWPWYVAAGLVFPAILFLGASIYRLLPGAAPLPIQTVTVGSLLPVGVFLVVSVLGEEIGWRGWALPRMQTRYTALESSLILGTLWTLWHLPFWVILDELALYGWGYWLLSWAWIVAGSIYLTWLMNHTGNSLLLAALFHWTYNLLAVGYLPLTTVVPAYRIMIVLAWVLALGLLALCGPGRLVRSYDNAGLSLQSQ